MSFKYRFILSFVTLEVFFIILIVSMNFTAINRSSNQLITQRNNSTISFLEELVKVPLSVYDLATLDNLTNSTADLDYINSILILDNKDRVVSSKYRFKYLSLDEILKIKDSKKDFHYKDDFDIKYKEFYEDNVYIGSLYLVLDNSDNNEFIYNTEKNTILIVFFEILISTILSYLIGFRLTNKLTNLSNIARHIGEEKNINIPYQDTSDEIGVLSKSLNQMQVDLKTRNDKLIKVNAELEQQKLELIETQKFKDSFFANISHELKTPLNSINILSSIMLKNKEGRYNEKDVNNLQIMNDCGKNLLNLINDVLDISKLEAGELNIDTEKFNFEEFIEKIKNMFLIQTEKKGLEFIFKSEKNIGNINNDKKLIGQVIINLLSNAVKFTDTGKIELIINDLDEKLEIIIKDEGIGIPSDKTDIIFDRFRQVDSGISRKYGGTGLGLAISKEIAKMLEGDIKVESIFGKGSTFILQIKKNLVEDLPDLILERELAQKNSSKVLLYSQSPIKYFNSVIQLKRQFEKVEHILDFNKLTTSLKEDYFFVILDYESIPQEELKKILVEYKHNFLIVCEEKEKVNWIENYEVISKEDLEITINKLVEEEQI